MLGIYLLLFGRAVTASFGTENEAAATRLEWDSALKQEVRMSAAPVSADAEPASKAMLQALGVGGPPVFRERAKTEPMAAFYDTILRFEQKNKPEPTALKLLEGSKEKEYRAAARIYRSEKLTPDQARAISDGLGEESYAHRLAKAHAYLKAGDASLHRELARPISMAPMIVLGIVGCLGILAGAVLWVLYLGLRSSGQIRPLGHPVAPLALENADRLVFRAVQMLALFYAVGTIGGIALGRAPDGIASTVLALTILASLFLLFKFPIYGWNLTASTLGLNGRNLGRNLAWGLAGYVALLPILPVTLAITLALGKVLPKPYHPVGQELMNSTDPWLIVGLFMQAAILAPFWEELMFRGCMFPAISRVLKSTLWGTLLSSFMFASIHPQGIAGWPSLFVIALVTCALAHQTKSLVPSIVLHALNNGLILAATLLVR